MEKLTVEVEMYRLSQWGLKWTDHEMVGVDVDILRQCV